MTKADMLVQDSCVWIGGKRFIDVALWQDGSVTIALSAENGAVGNDIRFPADSVQARMVHAVIATKEGEV
jgi:hypothetical protein